MCDTRSAGTVADLAIQGLADSGIDFEFRQFGGLRELEELVRVDEPVIAFLWHPTGTAHAVVVCDIGSETIIVMDPAIGDYLELPIDHFEAAWRDLQNEGMVIGTAQD